MNGLPEGREITQTILVGNPEGIPGNCVQAATASLLGLDLDEVPHFVLIGDWLEYLVTWAALRGWTVRHRNPGEYVEFGIASGPSERGVQHAVVMRNAEIVWDPHPSRAGLIRVSDIWEFTPADPTDSHHLWLLDTAKFNYETWGVSA